MNVLLLLAILIPAASQPAQGDLVVETLDSASLRGNPLGDSSAREVLIYLPPRYERDASRRYPVIYLLHSYGAGPRSWLGEDGYEDMDLRVAMDGLVSSGTIEPVIVVMPDARTRLGGSWYTDSSTAGAWERFVADDLVELVDERFRTEATREARGLAGQSMGGYGALRIAMHRSDVFGAVVGMSAPNLVNPDPFGAPAHEAALSASESPEKELSLLGRLMWSKAAAFSPNEDSPPFFADLPFERSSQGIVRIESVWERWLENCLVNEVPSHASRLQSVRILLEVGNRDPVRPEMMAFADALSQANVTFSLVVFEGGHVEGVRRRFEGPVFRFFDDFFNRAAGQ